MQRSPAKCFAQFSNGLTSNIGLLGKGGQNPLLAIWFAITGSRRVIFPIPKINKQNIERVRVLLQSGDFRRVVDKIFALDQIIDATEFVELGQKTGNVVINITEELPKN